MVELTVFCDLFLLDERKTNQDDERLGAISSVDTLLA